MARSIREMIRTIAEEGIPNIVLGKVTSIEPLRIVLEDDLKIMLSAQSVIASERILPIQIGDEFYMLAVNNNKIYYLLDRA